MRSNWKGKYMFGNRSEIFFGSRQWVFSVLFFMASMLKPLFLSFDKSLSLLLGVNKKGDLYLYKRSIVYYSKFFPEVIRFFLYNGRRFVWLRQLTASHLYVRVGELSLTKRLGRIIHFKQKIKKRGQSR